MRIFKNVPFQINLILFLLVSVAKINASSKFYYAEQWYVIFNSQMKKNPENYKKNIFFLQKALKYPFGNPKYSLTKIETKEQWGKYKLLFKMHVNLLLVRQNLYLGDLFDTRNLHFFKTPEKDGIISNLEKSKKLYKLAINYYSEALKYHKKLENYKSVKLENDGITNWEDEYHKISLKELNYYDIIEKELLRIDETKAFFKQRPKYY
ncbi:hypothetical protein QIA19_04535 [Borreliella finlandensis]|uniref:Uncharacterized protein n=1 Tax=Borreliella finlandensis TaxID=498741 RepID=A0A826HFP5_9SPIR|nr:hypothetical protein [Borreliella finlandensis]EEH01141.1 conserved hypothetical protein [Borreliella finlandensis]WKC90281.1 hypothetical protein QIA19_04535 [Borreliella finlandensis]